MLASCCCRATAHRSACCLTVWLLWHPAVALTSYSLARRQWHLGDLWDKKIAGYHGNYSSPTQHGFDDWLQTQAEASNSMPNCGCFPVNHASPGPKPPSGYSKITPHGNKCVVGGGHVSDWCYPCTDYYYPNASDPRGVSGLHDFGSDKP
eukprot:SAG22_NODE_11699_length_473_cov_0.967914_1_plen_149_part_10